MYPNTLLVSIVGRVELWILLATPVLYGEVERAERRLLPSFEVVVVEPATDTGLRDVELVADLLLGKSLDVSEIPQNFWSLVWIERSYDGRLYLERPPGERIWVEILAANPEEGLFFGGGRTILLLYEGSGFQSRMVSLLRQPPRIATIMQVPRVYVPPESTNVVHRASA